MKKTRVIYLFVFIFVASLKVGVAQKMDIKVREVTLAQLLDTIQSKGHYRAFFNAKSVEGIDKISMDVQNATLDEVLNVALKGTNLTYSVTGETVVISVKDEQEETKQEVRKIAGVVKDQNGVSLPGVTVLLKGTTIGVVSDENGEFKLEIPKQEGLILVFSFVGMETQELLLTDEITEGLEIILSEDVKSMDEVIVTGFGNKSKSSFTGSAVVVKKNQLLSVGTKNLLASLQAFVPGMQLVSNNRMGSDPNTVPEVLVRGRSSFEGSTNVPTFIVDGAEVDVNYIFDMDMNDVESVTILKDASATALYGAKAASGVIVITTKPLLGGKLRASYSGTLRGTFPDLRDYDLLNSMEKLEYEKLAGVYEASGNLQWIRDQEYNERYQRALSGVNTDWMAKAVRNSLVHNHSLSVYGGDEYIRYNLGVRYGDDQGVMKNSSRKRYSLSSKLSYNKGDAVFFQNTTTISSVNSEDTPYGSFSQYVALNPYDRAYNLDGSLNNDLAFDAKNPLYEASLGSFDKAEEFYIQNIFDAKFLLAPGLRVEGSFSLTKYKNDQERFISPDSKEFEGKAVSERGSMEITNSKTMTYEGKLLLTYNRYFSDNLLLNTIVGGNVQSVKSSSNRAKGIGILSDKLDDMAFATRYENAAPGGGSSLSRMVGAFVNANLIYDNRYFLDASYRYEGSSQFGSDQRFAPFWSVGVGWNIHKEKFLNLPETDVIKLRGSVGYVGKANFDPSQALTTYQFDASLNYDKGIGAVPITIGNPNLKWERTLNWNAGLDVVLFKNRLDFSVDLYKKVTDNLLLDVAKAPSIGISLAKENIGKINNTGIDLRARVVALQQEDWHWSWNLTLSHNKNEIMKISNALKSLNDKNNAEDSRTPAPVYIEGESTSALKVVKSAGIDPASGRELYVKRDGSLTFEYDYNDKVVYGDTDPKVYGAVGSYLMYKGFSLNLMFNYRLGATLYNETLVTRVEGANPRANADKRVFESRWKQVGDHAKYKNIADSSIPKQTSRFVEDEYRLDMTSISVGYDFQPNLLQRLKLRQLRVELLTNDLFNLSSIKQERGLDYPFARSFEFSIRATF